MSYIGCPCYSCNDRTTGAKRVACHSGCEKFAAWKAKRQKAREKKKKDKLYRSNTMAKFIKQKQMNQKVGRR